MSAFIENFNYNRNSITGSDGSVLSNAVFTPQYGAQMNFSAENSAWKGSNYSQFISPKGLNNLMLTCKLSFVENLNRTKTLLGYLESVTTGVMTGEQAFTGNLNYVNFGSANNTNGAKINLDNVGIYNNFSGSQVSDFTITDIGKDIYKTDVSLFNNTVSSVLNNGMGFVSDKTESISAGNFSKFDVVTGSTSNCNSTVFDNYFYLTGSRGSAISASDISGVKTYTGVSSSATRTFFWEPDRSAPISYNHIARVNKFPGSFRKQLNISENQNRVDAFELTFSNRTEKETYALLHFLESHLGNKHFVYYHNLNTLNKNKVYFCPNWNHTFNYKDSNTIKTTFVEIVTPLIPQL